MSIYQVQSTKPLVAFFACTKEGQRITSPSLKELASLPPLDCPECDGQLVLRLSKKHGFFYGCNRYPRCKATHGAHPDGTPLGTPADRETRHWRTEAHKAFDKLYQGTNPLMTRLEAYDYLQYIMSLSQEDAHISKFSIEQCQHLIDLLNDDNDCDKE